MLAFSAQGKEYTPQEIAAAVLAELKQTAEELFGPNSN